MRRSLVGLLALGVFAFVFAGPVSGRDDPQPRPKKPRKEEPSLHGTWKGERTLGTTRWKVTTTLRPNATYRTIMEFNNYVMAERGTYQYADGVLTTEPESGIPGTYVLAFEDKDTLKVKGEGLTITYKRQKTEKPEKAKKEPPLHGMWVGDLTLATTKWKVTTTLRPDGTYRTILESGDRVMADKGTFKYADGVLTTEPEGGIGGTFLVTFEDRDTIKVKGEGMAITYKRQ